MITNVQLLQLPSNFHPRLHIDGWFSGRRCRRRDPHSLNLLLQLLVHVFDNQLAGSLVKVLDGRNRSRHAVDYQFAGLALVVRRLVVFIGGERVEI